MTFAQLKTDSHFYPVFENGLAPVKSPITRHVRLEGSEETEVYMLDWSRCNEDQRKRIARLATSLRGGVAAEFISYMDDGGDMPVRVSQTTGVQTDLRAFL